jgi:ABC-type multidrug transport system fused ATPase/permease subunit
VGRTGSGKSSMMLTLFRILELEQGSITLDGVDIRRIGLRRLRSAIAMLPQDPTMFSGLRNCRAYVLYLETRIEPLQYKRWIILYIL